VDARIPSATQCLQDLPRSRIIDAVQHHKVCGKLATEGRANGGYIKARRFLDAAQQAGVPPLSRTMTVGVKGQNKF
jgi:hypothetical protein